MRLIVLRPEPGASATAVRARALGLEPVVAPLFEITPIPWRLPAEPFDALLLTSANAVRMAGPGLRAVAALPVYAVGAATADAARAAGLHVTGEGQGGVDDLLPQLPAGLRLLHLCGRDVSPGVPAAGTQRVPVYAARTLPPPELPAAGVALVHSTRAARRFAEVVSARAPYHLVAISRAAAGAAGPGWASVVTGAAPTDEAMLSLAAPLCKGAR